MSIQRWNLILLLISPAALAKTPAKPADAGPSCTAQLVAGNPNYRGSATPAASQAVMADPPVQLYGVATVKGALHGHTLYELWAIADAAKPDKIVRYAGVADGKYVFHDGACAGARFPQISGIAAAGGGALVITDRLANAVVRIEAPGQPGCTAKILAGSGPAPSLSPQGLNPGDQDGVGAAARFSAPEHPAVDERGNIYVVDNHNKLKRIAPDGRVTTVVALATDGADNYSAMTFMKGKLYLTYLQSTKNSVVEVDPATGKSRVLVSGNGAAFPPLESSVVPGLSAITSDGTQLYITGRGLVWSVATGGAVTLVAGSGEYEFGPRDDLAAARPAKKMTLPGGAGHVDMTFAPGAGLLFRGRAGYSNNSYLTRITCP
jgi:hypothetical protein